MWAATALRLAWSLEGGEKEVVPPEVLFHERAKPVPLTVMSDARGRFRIPNAPPGRYTLRAHVPGGFAAWENGREVTVEADKQLTNLDFTLPPFKQGRWKTYTHENGLAADYVLCVFQAADGAMWFGTDQGVSRFDGRTFSSLPPEDGLPRGTCSSDRGGRCRPDLDGRENRAVSLRPEGPFAARAPVHHGRRPSGGKRHRPGQGQGGPALGGNVEGAVLLRPGSGKVRGQAVRHHARGKSDQVKDLAPGGRHGALVGAARLVESLAPGGVPADAADDGREGPATRRGDRLRGNAGAGTQRQYHDRHGLGQKGHSPADPSAHPERSRRGRTGRDGYLRAVGLSTGELRYNWLDSPRRGVGTPGSPRQSGVGSLWRWS